MLILDGRSRTYYYNLSPDIPPVATVKPGEVSLTDDDSIHV